VKYKFRILKRNYGEHLHCWPTTLTLLSHNTYTAGPQHLHCWPTAFTLLPHNTYTAGPQHLHCCPATLTLLAHSTYTAAPQHLHCCPTTLTLLAHSTYTAAPQHLHCWPTWPLHQAIHKHIPILTETEPGQSPNMQTETLRHVIAYRTFSVRLSLTDVA
jgi:hypothetical protein